MIPSRPVWEPYLPLAQQVSFARGVPAELVLAVMFIESNFNPTAYRAEPQINDASRGLMQLLLSTARGLGFSGPADQLFVPATNADLGAKLLAQNLRARGGDVGAALSQYNGGYRPALGFGAKVGGRYQNQSYVDKGLAAVADFAAQLGAGGTPYDDFSDDGSGSGGPGPGPAGPSSLGTPALLVLAVVGAFALARLR